MYHNPDTQRPFRVAIMHAGAPAAGMLLHLCLSTSPPPNFSPFIERARAIISLVARDEQRGQDCRASASCFGTLRIWCHQRLRGVRPCHFLPSLPSRAQLDSRVVPCPHLLQTHGSLARGDVQPLEWGSVAGWTQIGGARLGTRRTLPGSRSF
jgi:hypothetical protein